MTLEHSHVVIVEDDAVLRRALTRIFTQEGLRVSEFGDGEVAFDAILKDVPEVIFCDYRLPGTTGIEMLRKLRSSGVQCRFVLMTAYFSDELKVAALESGAVAVLEKPLQIPQLMTYRKA